MTPGEVRELVNELGLRRGGRTVFVQELLDVALESAEVFGGQHRVAGRQAVLERVELRALFAGIGARAGRVSGVGAIDVGA